MLQTASEQLELGLDDELPEMGQYFVRESARAKHVSLRVIAGIGLEVTIPRRFSRRLIPQVIRDNGDWIRRQFRKQAKELNPEFLCWPPPRLRLAAVDEVVHVHYERSPQAAVTFSWDQQQTELHLAGSVQDKSAVRAALASALKAKATNELLPWLATLAQQHALSYRKSVIRGQRTLWGSYSSSGTLSLNYKLLFLPPELTRYVLLHELAHTRHLNHSRRFWALLTTLEPAARELDKALGAAAKLVPPWLEAI